MNEEIQTTEGVATIELSAEVSVDVQRLRRSEVSKLNRCLPADLPEAAYGMELACLIARKAIVGARGLLDPITKRPVPFARRRVGAAGMIASEEVLDALSEEDLQKVIEQASPMPLTEGQQGN